MKIQARKAPREPDTMISLDNRSLLLWHRGRQDLALPTTQRTISEEMEISAPSRMPRCAESAVPALLALRI
jgi:hypothetical protein